MAISNNPRRSTSANLLNARLRLDVKISRSNGLDKQGQPEVSIFNNFVADYSYKLSLISKFIDSHRSFKPQLEEIDPIIIQNFLERYPNRNDWNAGLAELEDYFCTIVKPI